jgi:hypothetical protein
MCKFNELLPQTKSEKAGALVWVPATEAESENSPFAGILTLTGKRCHCRYAVSEFPADHGRGFILKKIDTGSDREEGFYSCLVAGRSVMCECKGFISTGNCKHLSSLLTLIEAGQL